MESIHHATDTSEALLAQFFVSRRFTSAVKVQDTNNPHVKVRQRPDLTWPIDRWLPTLVVCVLRVMRCALGATLASMHLTKYLVRLVSYEICVRGKGGRAYQTISIFPCRPETDGWLTNLSDNT